MDAVRSGLAPPQKSKRPPTGGTVQRATFEGISSKNDNSVLAWVLQWATDLDRLAHQESVFGHAAVAERLSQKAAELRECGR